MKIKYLLASFLIALVPSLSIAQGRSVTILNMDTDARAVAMGGNYFGESQAMMTYNNATSLLYTDMGYNISVSGLRFPKVEGGGHQIFSVFSGSMKFGRHALHVGSRQLYGLKFTNDDTNMKIKPGAFTLDIAYAFRLNDSFAASAGVTFLQNKPAATSANTVAFNAAAYYRTSQDKSTRLLLGLNAGNAGPELDYNTDFNEQLPVYFGAGGELDIDLSAAHRLAFSASARYYNWPKRSQMFIGNFGAEYSYEDWALRAGYSYGENDNSSYALGIGCKYASISYVHGLGDNPFHAAMATATINF